MGRNSKSLSIAVGIVALGSLALPLPANANNLARLLACSDIPRSDERLQCYDAASRTAIGLATANPNATPETKEVALRERLLELEKREAALLRREQAVNEMEATVRQLKTKMIEGAEASAPQMSVASVTAPEQAAPLAELAKREQAIKAREAELNEREARLSKTDKSAEEEATLFGIPIPFTSKDTFNQVTELPNQTVERDDSGVVESITVAVREWAYSVDNRLTVVLENGQVWRQIDGDEHRLKEIPGKPNVVKISRGALGSFNMKINDSNRLIKVRRIDGKGRKS